MPGPARAFIPVEESPASFATDDTSYPRPEGPKGPFMLSAATFAPRFSIAERLRAWFCGNRVAIIPI